MTGLILYFAVSLLIGILACFFGKKMFFQVFAAVAFLVVFDIALTRGDGTTLTLIIAVLLGVAAAFLSKYLYKLSVFLLGALAGAGIGSLLSTLLASQIGSYSWAVILGCAMLLGFCALRWGKLFIIGSTAYLGAGGLAPRVYFLVQHFADLNAYAGSDIVGTMQTLHDYVSGPFADANSEIILTVTIVLTICGFLFQRFFGWKD